MELAIGVMNTNEATSMAWTIPFPFLHLPPGLRNHTYRYLLACNVGHAATLDNRYVDMTRACKQFQAEFRPLYWKGVQISIALEHMYTFITAFFKPVAPSVTIPQVVVSVGDHDVLARRNVDMLALLSAKASN
jgi:hypothetical protein